MSSEFVIPPTEPGIGLEIFPQPDDQTCGPTCLHAVYGYYHDSIPLHQVVAEVPQLETGGTLAVILANHALRRGYKATIYTYNLNIFDPTWFIPEHQDLVPKLEAQARAKPVRKLRHAIYEYLDFLELGGQLRYEDLSPALLRRHLDVGRPILTGLSATYLYQCAREHGADYDDVKGEPMGHFVVLCRYNRDHKKVLIADPLLPNPVAPTHQYEVTAERVITSILLGILTYDANLLIIEPQ